MEASCGFRIQQREVTVVTGKLFPTFRMTSSPQIKQTGRDPPRLNVPFADKPQKLAYMWRDIERRASMYDIPASLCLFQAKPRARRSQPLHSGAD
jgi:hypothetical protein